MYIVQFNDREDLGYVMYPKYFDESQVRFHVFEHYREFHPIVRWYTQEELEVLLLTEKNVKSLEDFERSL